jgi:alkylated DNA repair dioxygenase AlkB
VPAELDLTIDRAAPAQRYDLGDGSWCSLTTAYVREAEHWFDELHRTTGWLQNEVLRYDKYVPEQRLGASLRCDDIPLLRQSGLALEAAHRVRLTGVGALLYRTGEDFQGLHSDREMRWLDDTIVAIVVLGQRRPFVFRRRRGTAAFVERTPAGELEGDLVLLPGEGDLLVMGGACQRDWLHGVPRAAVDAPRISLTWRWTSKRGRPDTNPGYYEGRQYSDRPRQPGTRLRRP